MSQLNILYVQAKNFGPYKEVRLEFNKGMCLIEGWNYDEDTSNGAGKTFLLDLVSYCLFDEVPRDLKVDEIINDEVGKDCLVEICFELHGSTYQIIKKRKPNDAQIIKDGIELDRGKDLKETRQMIQDIIKFDYSTFANSIYLSQDDKSRFIALPDPKKQEILTQVLDLSIFDKAYKAISQKIKDSEIEYANVSLRAESIIERVNELKVDISNLQIKANNFNYDLQSEYDQKQNEVMVTQEHIQNLFNQFNEIEQRVFQDIPPVDFSVENSEIQVINQKLTLKKDIEVKVQDLRQQKFHKEAEASKLKSDLIEFNSVGGFCSKCKQNVSGEHLQREKDELNNKITDLVSQSQLLETEIHKYDQVLIKFSELEQRKLQIENQMRQKKVDYDAQVNQVEFEKRSNIQKSEQIKQDLNRYAQSLKIQQDQLKKIKDKTNDYQSMVLEKEARLEEEVQRLQEIFDKRVQIETFIKKYDVLKRMYKNIKYYVFANMVNSLNERIKYYLDKLFKRSVTVNLKTETKNTKGEVKQKFSTEIYKDQKKKSYNSLSKGEKQKVSLATIFAFADVLSSRSSNSLNLLFLDEILGDGLDGESAAKVVDLLEEIKNKRSILIIDHHEYVKVLVDRIIRVEKRNDISILLDVA